MNNRTLESVIACHDAILDALRDEASHRREHDDWEQRERAAVVCATNRYADAHYLNRTNVHQVETVEPLAIGHIDYAHKLSLYVSELVHGVREVA